MPVDDFQPDSGRAAVQPSFPGASTDAPLMFRGPDGIEVAHMIRKRHFFSKVCDGTLAAAEQYVNENQSWR
ncbi:hypothetical protein ASC90_27375 [Rhizobium sp. Root1220]|nr:hypothetical protein ASC90_27375 [Rhizobium sp. Root1220]